jgi:hypothetical protein
LPEGSVVERDEIPLASSKEVLMRLPVRAIALPVLAAAVLLVSGCQESNEGAHPDVKADPEPGAKTSFNSYGEAMQYRAEEAAKNKAAAKDKPVNAAPAKTSNGKPKP